MTSVYWNGRTFQKRSGVGPSLSSVGSNRIVEPALRLGKALVLAQVDGDGERHVVEQLPVVDRVGTAGREVEVLDRVGLLHQLRIGFVRGIEEVRVQCRFELAVWQSFERTVRLLDILRIRRLQPGGTFTQQTLHQLLHVGMLVQVEAIADSRSWMMKYFVSLRLDDAARRDTRARYPAGRGSA